MAEDRNPAPEFVIPDREGGALVWSTGAPDVLALQGLGWTVRSFRDLRETYIKQARSAGTSRRTLANPAQPLLDLVGGTKALAVVGVNLATPADLRDLYGFVIEPAYRRGTFLLIAADRSLESLDPSSYAEPIGFAWTLERLRFVADRFRIGPAADDMPPLTPIEALLYRAMRDRQLTPVAQYGIGRLRADFAFPDVRLVVECDGRPWHDPDRDRARDAKLRKRGWEPIHFTGSEITRDAAGCASRVEREIVARRATMESEQPEIIIPVRRSWWTRLREWLEALFARRPRAAAVASPPNIEDFAGITRETRAWTRDLDPEQQRAVTSHDGVVQVIAPAGSGKTTVLVARVRELISRGVPPNRILCCTFNKDAAKELQERLDQSGVQGVTASTFHATGRAILKRADLLRPDVGTLSYGQLRRIAKLAMDATRDGIWIEAPDAQNQISDLKLGRMLTVSEFREMAASPAERTLAELYRLHEEELERQDRNDYDDYIFGAVRLLQRDPVARRYWQAEYQAVLVDEYQDIEPAQELLIQMLAAPEDLLLCVGDEDQCLYAWRRASVERVIELDQVYPGLERHALARNYRCPSLVVAASGSLIARNRRRFPKEIIAVQEQPGEITLAAAKDLEAQGAHAARLVKDLSQGDAVILARSARILSEIAVGLAQAGIRFFGPERILRRSGEPAVLVAYLRVLGAPGRARPEDVKQVFRVPNRYLPDDAEDNLASALRGGLSFSAAIARLRVREPWRTQKLEEAGRLFDSLAPITDASTLIGALRTVGGLDRHYADAEQLNPTDMSAVDTLKRAQDASSGMSVSEYADALDYEASIIEQHFDKKGVELSTIHGAKGRQWPLVIVAGLQEGDLPHARSLSAGPDPDGELEGERRLAYVAMTRAGKSLVLLHSAEKPSRFLAEAALQVDGGTGAEAARPPSGSPGRPGAGQALNGGQRAPVRVPSAPRPDAPAATSPAKPRLSAELRPDGSIACSLPGCGGFVAVGAVRGRPGAYSGLCPLEGTHELLTASNWRLMAPWRDLQEAAGIGPGSRMDPVNANPARIMCGLPGCDGTVDARYAFRENGVLVGLCARRTLHERLAGHDPRVRRRLAELNGEAVRPRSDPHPWTGGDSDSFFDEFPP